MLRSRLRGARSPRANMQGGQIMPTRRSILKTGVCGLAAISASRVLGLAPARAGDKVTHTDAEWQKLLSEDQYAVRRKEATERPFTCALLREERAARFTCAGGALPLFSSKT